MKNTIGNHEHEYKPNAWREYSIADLGQWVHLLATRARHRADAEKRKKDLADARNYLAMEQHLEELERQ